MTLAELQLDARRPNWVTFVGRKGSGKSHLAQFFWDSYPLDRLVVDPTGDVDPHDEKASDLETPLPTRWPGNVNGERTTLRFPADPGSDTYLDDLDAAVGLAFNHGKSLLWIDEVGELTNAHRTPPAMRRLLQQSRHRDLSILACGPRPIDINPLVLSQADYIAAFHTPNPRDRQRLADTMGLELKILDDAHNRLVEHGFLWWNAIERELLIMPPLPRLSRRPTAKRFEPVERPLLGDVA
jgi:hypothetical protein